MPSVFLRHRGCYILCRQHGEYVGLQKALKQLQRKERKAENQGQTDSGVLHDAGRVGEEEPATYTWYTSSAASDVYKRQHQQLVR